VFLTVVSLVEPYVFYRLGRKSAADPCLVAVVKSNAIFNPEGETGSEFEVTYRDQTVPQATYTSVGFRNTGPKDIQGKNITAGDPLRVCLPREARVLDCGLRYTEDHQKSVAGLERYTEDERHVSLKVPFGLLKPGDSFSVWLLHTAAPGRVHGEGTIVHVAEIEWRGQVNGRPIMGPVQVSGGSANPLPVLVLLFGLPLVVPLIVSLVAYQVLSAQVRRLLREPERDTGDEG